MLLLVISPASYEDSFIIERVLCSSNLMNIIKAKVCAKCIFITFSHMTTEWIVMKVYSNIVKSE